jgi:XTP/dITP diphosphohydrolase
MACCAMAERKVAFNRMQLIVATGNKGKLREFEERLEPLGWQLLPMPTGLPMPEETGSTYEENALIKAACICHATQMPALADDSGLEVDALNGAPGVYSARFGGFATDLERNLHLLEALRHIPEPRAAKFVSVVTLAFPDGHVESYRGESAGVILEGPRGEGGFGYDPLFFVPELGKTFAELTLEEKRQISHRGRALEKMLEIHKSGAIKREASGVE